MMCVCMCVIAHGHRRVVVVVAGTLAQQVIPSSYSTDTSSSTHAHDDELLGPHLLCARTQTLIYMTNEEERRGGAAEMRLESVHLGPEPVFTKFAMNFRTQRRDKNMQQCVYSFDRSDSLHERDDS